MSKKTKKGKIEPFEKTHPHYKDLPKFLKLLNNESDRGAVLISCSSIDDLLRKMILAFLLGGKEKKKLVEGYNAPLGTFSTRISAAYSLGLIYSFEFYELEKLRKIRNLFAHSVEASFQDEKIKKICRELLFAPQDFKDVKVNERGKYTGSALSLILNLTVRGIYVERDPLKLKVWEPKK